MSDSDEDIMGETIHRLRHNIMNSTATTMNNSNITSFSYRQNSGTSTFKPNNYREINVLQNPNQVHNIYYRRETSPMSLQSFRNSPDGISSHISANNGRVGPPTCMRSIDSNSVVNAVVIAQALSSNKFNKCDLRLIKEAYIKLMKNQKRKRIGRRKKLKLYFKGHRRNPGDDDSGELGSDSSMSSDDCRSTRTFHYSKRSGSRSTNMDVKHFRSCIRDSDMYIDRTDTLRQTSLHNILALNNTNETHEKHDTIIYQNQKCNSIVQQTAHKNISNITLKKQLTKGTNSYLLPSQRFNKTNINSNNTGTSINQRKIIHNGDKNSKRHKNDKCDVTSVISICNTNDVSDTFTDEEIFKTSSNLDKRQKTKRPVSENVKNPVDLINNKKPKIATPCKVTGQKLPITKSKENQREIEAKKSNRPNKKLFCFWDTDFESDIEETNVTPWKSSKCVVGEEIEKGTICNNTVINVVNKKNNTEETILTIPSLQNKTINNSMRSDENKTRKKTIIEENKDNNIIAKNSQSNKESQTYKNLNKDAKNKKSKPMKKDSESKLENENLKPKSVQTKKKATKNENTCITSKRSLRLKERNEKKELAKCNISEENDDPIKLNKSTTRNNKSNDKNNNNNKMKNNNDNTMTSSVKKNCTIEKTPKKKRQTRNSLATPVSFNINNRSVRVRYTKYKCSCSFD